MKIICMVKYVPDVDKFKYDLENNTVIRENIRMILNPDDVCAVAFALKVKKRNPDVTVEIVSMGPNSVLPLIEDLIKMGVDKGTLITDSVFAGSDSYATSKILCRYLSTASYDLILTGTHAIDGDTSHVPSQMAEILNLYQMSNVIKIDEDSIGKNEVIFTMENDVATFTYKLELPAILSLLKESKYKLPYIKYEDLEKDVRNNIDIISNDDLNLAKTDVGAFGSLTKVNRTFVKEYKKRNKIIFQNDEEGINRVYQFLKEKGFI